LSVVKNECSLLNDAHIQLSLRPILFSVTVTSCVGLETTGLLHLNNDSATPYHSSLQED